MAPRNEVTSEVNIPDAINLSTEAQARVNIAAKEAMRIIENNPELETVLRDNLKNSVLDAILKNPMMIESVLDEVDRRFKERLKAMPGSERLKAIKWYADLTEQLGLDIAQKTLDINLAEDIKKARIVLEAKTESLRNTYKNLEQQLKTETLQNK